MVLPNSHPRGLRRVALCSAVWTSFNYQIMEEFLLNRLYYNSFVKHGFTSTNTVRLTLIYFMECYLNCCTVWRLILVALALSSMIIVTENAILGAM
jgi:hypothetical protein